ncbi:hypothetical protein COEX109129_41510 [Corallococcus exiguus]
MSRVGASARSRISFKASGRSGLKTLGAANSPRPIRIITAGGGPSTGSFPQSSSYSTTPVAQTSVRASTSSPRACSGEKKRYLPFTTPGAVLKPRMSWALAMPKSTILT